jgi:hypothetical protein
MRIALGRFATSAVGSGLGGDRAAVVRIALYQYFRSLRSRRPPLPIPGFCRAAAPTPRITFEVEVDPEVETELAAEASRQEATLEQLATHAIFVYLADLDRPTSAAL